MGLFNNRTKHKNETGVPVWFMRQAGRYHSHYRKIKANSDFITMCKDPKLACEVTLGPIDEFDFDAAILFSDILFPLEQLGMGLEYNPSPKMNFRLESISDIKKLKKIDSAENFYNFQSDALKMLKQQLPTSKSLLGFVGAPFTLYAYAVEGGHSGNLVSSKLGLHDGRFAMFMELLIPELVKKMIIQAKAGADAIAIFDTAAGELSLHDYKKFVIPVLKKITGELKASCPKTKIIYYSKFTQLEYLDSIEDKNIDVLGIDWRCGLPTFLKHFGDDYMIQGNIDPAWLHLPWDQLKQNLTSYWQDLKSNDLDMDRWICGLGHGVLIQTPEINVKNSVDLIHKLFRY